MGSGYASTLHAEGSAIQDALKNGIDPDGSTIYIYRRNGNLSCPCPDCMQLLMQYGINSIVYSNLNGEEKLSL